MHGQLGPAAKGIAADRCNDGLGALLNGGPDALGVALHDLYGAAGVHALDVAACRKHLVAAGQNDAAHAGVCAQLGEGPGQRSLQRKTQRVRCLGAVELNDCHAMVLMPNQ